MIAVLADTHMPKGSRRLPARCVELVEAAEATIHAGDFFGASALAEIEALTPVTRSTATSTSRRCARCCRRRWRSSWAGGGWR
jgi:hypothetical protein